MNQSLYSLSSAAARASEISGKTVGNDFVSSCVHALRGSAERFSSSTRFTHEEVLACGNYAAAVHGKRGEQPGIVEWLESHNMPLPKPYHPPVPAKTKSEKSKKSGKKAAVASSRQDERTIARIVRQELAKEGEQMRREIRAEILTEIRGDRSEIRELTDSGKSTARARIVKLVRSFVFDRGDSIDHQTAWTEVYRRFWHRIGDGNPPESWWQSQLESEHKLDWFASQGMLTLLAETLPSILTEMSREYAPNAKQQGELGI